MRWHQYPASFKKVLASLWFVLSTAYRVAPVLMLVRVIDALFSATIPLATAYFAGLTTTTLVDAFAGVSGAYADAVFFVLLTALLTLISAGWDRVGDYLTLVSGNKIKIKLGEEVFRKYLALDFWRYDDKETIELKDQAERFSARFEQAFNNVIRGGGTLVAAATAIGALWYVSPLIGMVMILGSIPIALVQIHVSKLDIDWWNGDFRRWRIMHAIENRLAGETSVTSTRIFNLGSFFLQKRRDLLTALGEEDAAFQRVNARWWFVSYIAENSMYLFALVYAVYQVASQLKPVGHFVFIESVASRAVQSLAALVRQFGQVGEGVALFEKYNEFLKLSVEHTGTAILTQPFTSLAFEHVSFRYQGSEHEVLQNISLEIQKGEHVAIVGENGAGKSTFIKLLLGMYPPTEGSMHLNGQEMRSYDLDSWHRKIGVLFQDFETYDFASVRDNVTFGNTDAPSDEDAVQDALRRAQALGFVEKLSRGLDTVLNPTYGEKHESVELSGGQGQRLAIARVFYRRPELLILDEPTSALDAKAEAEIFQEIQKEMHEKTVVMISHRFSTVRKAHKIVVLESGRITEVGTHEELMAKRGTYHTMFELQAKEYR